jgi:hypothetical protein
MPSVLRSLAVFSFVSAFAVLSAPGCSQQGEGERCDKAKNGDDDCDDGLVCVGKNELVEGITDRCCPADANAFNDSRCTRGTPMSTGGTSSGGSSGTSGDAGAPDGALGGAAGGEGVPVAGAGGAPVAAAGAASTGGSPPTSEGGMSGAAGAPLTTDGGSGASTAGQGGAG